MPKHKRKTVVVSEPYPKKNTQQQPSKEQGEQQPSVDQSTVTQVNKYLYCDNCTKSVDHLLQCEKCETWYCISCGNVPIQVMEIINDYRQLHWFCNTCDTQIHRKKSLDHNIGMILVNHQFPIYHKYQTWEFAVPPNNRVLRSIRITSFISDEA